MNGFLTRPVFFSLLLVGLASSAFAQNPPDVPARGASFLPDSGAVKISDPVFSGLATTQPESVLPAPVVIQAPSTKPAELTVQPVAAAPLANVSPESIGLPNTDGLGAEIWKGTSHGIAEHLLALIGPTSSPVLNGLVRRLLTTAAAPPEGDAESTQSLTSARVEKLVLFGDSADAWALTERADPKLIDDITFRLVAENALISGGEDLCPQAQELAKKRTGADWQKFLIVCQLRAKDTAPAQVSLDVYRSQNNRDNVFLNIADKNVLTTGKGLPFQLTPLTPATLALLQMANLPLPGSLYAHADFSFAPALLRIPAQQDVAQLALAERALASGIIGPDALAAVYRAIIFSPDALAAPLTSSESGLRLHALLYQAALGEKDAAKKISYAIKFMQSASPSFLNGAGALLAGMLGDIKADPAMGSSAASVARIYMLAGKGDAALEWYRLAQSNTANADDVQALWPQFALAGLETESAYAPDLDKWLDTALKAADAPMLRDVVAPTLLLLDAGGLKVPDTAWEKVMTTAHSDKKTALSPLLFDRMQTAAAANRRAETVLLATALAGDGDISVFAGLGITRALRQIGFKSEAAIFARQAVALLAKAN
jgi:hypothetical protein